MEMIPLPGAGQHGLVLRAVIFSIVSPPVLDNRRFAAAVAELRQQQNSLGRAEQPNNFSRKKNILLSPDPASSKNNSQFPSQLVERHGGLKCASHCAFLASNYL